MFERFTEKAIKVIMLAQEEARRLGHNFVGTEQILLGLIGEGTGVAAKVLKSLGVNLKDSRIEVEKIILEVSQGNVTAENFYSRFDFSTVGIRKNYYKDGSHALLKEKKLTGK